MAALFTLQLLLTVLAGVAPLRAAPLLVPICADGHLVWIDPAAAPGQDDDGKAQHADCAKCCPHLANLLLPPSPPRLVELAERRVEPAVLPPLAVRAGRATAPPSPPRGPPSLQA